MIIIKITANNNSRHLLSAYSVPGTDLRLYS